MLGIHRCINIFAQLHCKHSSTAKICAILAYLLLSCSKCHELLNHEASQSNSCACLSAAGAKAEFMYPAIPKGTKQCQNDMIRYLAESQLNCDSGGMPPMAIGARAAPPHGYRRILFWGRYGAPQVHTEDSFVLQVPHTL
jgi:hypothetical protein